MKTREEIEAARMKLMARILDGARVRDPLELVDLRARYQVLGWVLVP